LSQSYAIMRYLAHKHDLLGKTDESRWRSELALEQVKDLRIEWLKVVYHEKFVSF